MRGGDVPLHGKFHEFSFWIIFSSNLLNKKRTFSYFNNVFSKEGLVSEGKLLITGPKTKKNQKRDKGTKSNF